MKAWMGGGAAVALGLTFGTVAQAGCDVFIVQSHAEPINASIMEQLIMIDAAKRASAKRITAVRPTWG